MFGLGSRGAPMSIDQVWHARLDEPHPRSYLAFIMEFHDQVERVDGSPPNYWIGPVDLSQVPTSARSYWTNWNPVLQAFDEAMRATMVERLGAILAPGLTYDHPAVEPLFEVMVEGHRAALIAEDIAATFRVAPLLSRYPVKAIDAFIFFVKSELRHKMPGASENALNAAVAEYLSHGIPSGQARKYAITRNHVDRACKRFMQSLRGRVNSAATADGREKIIEATFLLWSMRLATIEAIARAASSRPEFRGKTGSELVAAIEKAHGAHKTFYRMLERQDVRWRA